MKNQKKSRLIKAIYIEDDESDFYILERTLEEIDKYNVELIRCLNIKDAVRTLENDPQIELCFIDYVLEGETAIDFLKTDHISKFRDKYSNIIFSSHSSKDEILSDSFRSGADFFLSKGGLTVDGLRRTLDLVFSKKEFDDEQVILRDKQKIDENLRSLGEVAAGIAHEISNILQGVSNSMYLLQKKINGGEDVNNIISTILEFVHQGNSVTQNVIGLSRDGLDNQNLSVSTPLDTSKIIAKTCRFIEIGLPSMRSLRTEIIDKNLLIKASESQLIQVLLNLIKNAFQAMNFEGEVFLSTFLRGDKVVISVKDQGEGIEQDKINQIFKAFSSTKINETDKKKKGLGLGLNIVQKIVERHNAKLNVLSTLGEGTTFEIEFDQYNGSLESFSEEKSEHKPTSRAAKLNDNPVVVFVDDEEILIEVLKEFLSDSKKMKSFYFTSGLKALDFIKKNKVDILFTDHNMPKLSGVSLIQKARELKPDLKCFIASGDFYISDHVPEDIQVLVKPYDITELETKLLH